MANPRRAKSRNCFNPFQWPCCTINSVHKTEFVRLWSILFFTVISDSNIHILKTEIRTVQPAQRLGLSLAVLEVTFKQKRRHAVKSPQSLLTLLTFSVNRKMIKDAFLSENLNPDSWIQKRILRLLTWIHKKRIAILWIHRQREIGGFNLNPDISNTESSAFLWERFQKSWLVSGSKHIFTLGLMYFHGITCVHRGVHCKRYTFLSYLRHVCFEPSAKKIGWSGHKRPYYCDFKNSFFGFILFLLTRFCL